VHVAVYCSVCVAVFVLQCVAVCCSVLRCVAMCCSVLQTLVFFLAFQVGLLIYDLCDREMYFSLQHTATHCNTLQHAATHCNTLQHITVHFNTLQHSATHCTTQQLFQSAFLRTATCAGCSELQCVTTMHTHKRTPTHTHTHTCRVFNIVLPLCLQVAH